MTKTLSIAVDEETIKDIDKLAEDFDSRSEAIRALVKLADEDKDESFGKNLAEKRKEAEKKRRERQAKLASEWKEAGV